MSTRLFWASASGASPAAIGRVSPKPTDFRCAGGSPEASTRCRSTCVERPADSSQLVGYGATDPRTSAWPSTEISLVVVTSTEPSASRTRTAVELSVVLFVVKKVSALTSRS